jgi:hypothetical protein
MTSKLDEYYEAVGPVSSTSISSRNNSGANLMSGGAGPPATTNPTSTGQPKLTLDQIASCLLKQNFILTALEFHTELAENGHGELPRLRDFFSNPANFEQPQQQQQPHSSSSSNLNGQQYHSNM